LLTKLTPIIRIYEKCQTQHNYKSIKDGKLELDESIIVSSNYINQVIAELKNKKTDYRNLRQIIADLGVKDFEEPDTSLSECACEYATGREGSVSLV